jgi:hypothetical protein
MLTHILHYLDMREQDNNISTLENRLPFLPKRLHTLYLILKWEINLVQSPFDSHTYAECFFTTPDTVIFSLNLQVTFL